MSRAHRLAFALFVPIFMSVLWLVRAGWLAYVALLTDFQLHQRVFDHSIGVSLALWTGCLLLALLLSLGLGHLLTRRSAADHRGAAGRRGGGADGAS